MQILRFRKSETLAIARWMVRTRLLETLCEDDPLPAFDARIKNDFAELIEGGLVTFAEAAYDRGNRIRVVLHFADCRYEFGAVASDGVVQVDRRTDYFET